MLLVSEISTQRAAEQTTLAWLVANLSRGEKLPSLDELLPASRRTPRDPAERAAEMRASMAVYREIAAHRGQIKSWAEWQT